MRRQDESRDHIAVAAPRPPAHRREAQRRPVGSAADAGLALIVAVALVAAAGGAVGRLLGAAVAGSLVGGFAGLVAGFVAVYLRYRDI